MRMVKVNCMRISHVCRRRREITNNAQFLSSMEYPKLAREMIPHSHRASPINYQAVGVFIFVCSGKIFNDSFYLILKSWRFGTAPSAPREVTVLIRPTLRFFLKKIWPKWPNFFSFELRRIKKNTWFAFVTCDAKSCSYQYSIPGSSVNFRPALGSVNGTAGTGCLSPVFDLLQILDSQPLNTNSSRKVEARPTF